MSELKRSDWQCRFHARVSDIRIQQRRIVLAEERVDKLRRSRKGTQQDRDLAAALLNEHQAEMERLTKLFMAWVAAYPCPPDLPQD